jgi:hypothetical protein
VSIGAIANLYLVAGASPSSLPVRPCTWRTTIPLR